MPHVHISSPHLLAEARVPLFMGVCPCFQQDLLRAQNIDDVSNSNTNVFSHWCFSGHFEEYLSNQRKTGSIQRHETKKKRTKASAAEGKAEARRTWKQLSQQALRHENSTVYGGYNYNCIFYIYIFMIYNVSLYIYRNKYCIYIYIYVYIYVYIYICIYIYKYVYVYSRFYHGYSWGLLTNL